MRWDKPIPGSTAGGTHAARHGSTKPARAVALGLLLLAPVTPALAEEAQPWSLSPLNRPEVPREAGVTTSIDAFIVRQLRESGLELSPPADRATWLRRVTFDLCGLPPSPEESRQFLGDEEPGAHERVVDRLLASPRYGERWARHWMDLARFAETQGHDEDAIRENAWPYRDWLIRSFNDDLPYREFVRAQVAGDILTPDDPWAVAATGFLAAGPWDGSSQMGIQDGTADKKIAQYLDRDDILSATMATFTSTTVHCARCHDHKFDPITLRDYYALQAVFAGIEKTERPFDTDPAVARERRRLLAQQCQLVEGSWPDENLDTPDIRRGVAQWETELRGEAREWRTIQPTEVSGAEATPHTIRQDHAVLFGGTAPERDTYTVRGTITSPRLTALQLEVLADPSLPQGGPGRASNGNLHLSEIALRLDGRPLAIASALADFNQDGWEIAKAIDGNPETAWGIHPQEGSPHRAVFVLAEPLTAVSNASLEVVLDQQHGGSHLIGCLRIALTGAETPQLGEVLTPELADVLALPAAQRSTAQRHDLARAWLTRETARKLAALPPAGAVFAVASDFPAQGNFKPPTGPREVHVLERGDIHSPRELAQAGALSCLPALPSRFDLPDPDDEGARRAALADWLTHHDNVLTWRSLVNRLWHYHFGRGIVATPNDFGAMGTAPTHRELLDWLAVAFRDDDVGSLKAFHRRLVLSATYRQSSDDRPDGLARDPANLLLWRMNRQRLDAECIRDAVLFLSGKLDLTMGGPSARHFTTSKGVHVTPVVHYRAFDPDDPANFRRSIYRFVFRTVPDPLMQALDCPDASQRNDRRATSTTALQALALLNNPFLVRQCEHIAARLQEEHDTIDDRISSLFRHAYGREPNPDELADVTTYARAHGLANACRVVLNSSEFLYLR